MLVSCCRVYLNDGNGNSGGGGGAGRRAAGSAAAGSAAMGRVGDGLPATPPSPPNACAVAWPG